MRRDSQKQSVSPYASRRGKLCVGAACAAALFAARTSFAQSTYDWSVAPTGVWSDATKWTVTAGGGTPPPVAGDTATFNTQATPAAETITLDGGKSAAAVVISNTQTTNIVGAASGNGLTLTSGLTVNSGAGAVLIGAPTISTTITAVGTINLTNNSVNMLTLQANGVGNTALIGSAANTTVNVDGTGYVSFAGSVRGGNINLNITGGGYVDLAGTSPTFAGINVSNGKLLLHATNALAPAAGAPVTLTLSGGAVGSIGTSLTIPANVSVAVTADSTIGDVLATTTTFAGSVTLSNGTRTLHMVKNLYLPGAVTNASGGLTIDSGGTLTISNTANSWTTSTTIISGQLNPGTTTIGGNPLILPPVPMLIGTGGTLQAGLAGNLSFASLSDYNNTGGAITMGNGSADKMTVGTDGTSSTFSGVFSGLDPNGNGEFYKVGAGTLTLKGASTFNGLVWVKEGVLQFTSVRNTGSTSNSSLFEPTGSNPINTISSGQNVTDLPTGTLLSTIQLGSGTTTGTLRFVGSSLGSTNRLINLGGSSGGGVLDASGSGTAIFTVAGGVTNTPELVSNVSGPGGDKTLTLTGTNTGTFSGAITETGPGVINLFKDGTNLWTIQSSASTYTGTTIVNAGTLQAQSVTALGAGSAGVTVNTNGALTFNTTSATGNFTKPLTVSGPGTGTAGGGALNAGDNSNVNFTQPVTLAGDTTLLVTGLGTATYTGGITTGANNYNLLVRGGASTGGGGGNVTGGISLGTGSLTKDQGGTWNLSGPLNYSGATNMLAGNLVLGTSLTTSSNVSVSGGTLQLASNGTNNRVIHTGAVAVTGGQIDLTDNKMITTTGAGTATGGVYTAGSVQQMVHDGLAGGAWTGVGIVTSQTTAQGPTPLTTLAVATASDVGFGGTKTFGGETVNSTDTLVMYTYDGDMTLDGQINGDDYFRIDNGFANNLTGYENGDLNYDGRIDADDYFIIDANYGKQSLGIIPSAGAPFSFGAVAAVPEPASLALLAVATAGLMPRRRRRP